MFRHIPAPLHTFAVPNKTAVIFDLIISEIKLESLRPQDKITPTGDSFKNKAQT